MFPFSRDVEYFSVDLQTLQAYSPQGTCVGFSQKQNLCDGAVWKGPSLIPILYLPLLLFAV